MGFDKRPHNPGSFSALLGGDDWSFALSKYEYDDFVKVIVHDVLNDAAPCCSTPVVLDGISGNDTLKSREVHVQWTPETALLASQRTHIWEGVANF